MENETFTHPCPNCGLAVKLASPRYTGCLCLECEKLLTDDEGRLLRATNLTMSGGFIAFHNDDTVCDVASDRHLAFLGRDRYCWNEARFGGTVAMPWTSTDEETYGQRPLGGTAAYWAAQLQRESQEAEARGEPALIKLVFPAFLYFLKLRNETESQDFEDWAAKAVAGSAHARGVLFTSKKTGRSWVYYDYFLHFDSEAKQWTRWDSEPDPAYGSPVLVSEVTSNVNGAGGLIYSHYMNWAH